MRLNNLFLVLSAVLLSACTSPSSSTYERHAPPLVVARAGDLAVLSWQSQAGNLYTVLFSDSMPAQWQPLVGASRIRGNGREFRIEDQVPYGSSRQYRLMIEPAGR